MRQQVDTLHAYMFDVVDGEMPEVSDGQPVHDMNGVVKTRPVKILVFVDPQTGHQVNVPLHDHARSALIEKLTGGVHIPKIETPIH